MVDDGGKRMRSAVSVTMAATPRRVWEVVSDVRNTSRFSPEVFEAEWVDAATGPAVGAWFRGHVRRNEIGPVYWTRCRVTACVPGEEFGFAVVIRGRDINNWHYRFVPTADGVEVTESFDLPLGPLEVVAPLYFLRRRRNRRDMLTTLNRVEEFVEKPAAAGAE